MKKSNSLFRQSLIGLVLATGVSVAAAKLPVAPETPESKAKTEEVAAKAAVAAKKDAEDLGRAQDKAVANLKERAPK